MLKETKVLEITKEGVVVENAEGVQTLPADTVVIAAGAKPNNDMYEQLVGKVKQVDCIGDAVNGRKDTRCGRVCLQARRKHIN